MNDTKIEGNRIEVISRALRMALSHDRKTDATSNHEVFSRFCEKLHRIITVLFADKAQVASPEMRDFVNDVFCYLIYEHCFLGFDLGSLHEAVMCTRYVAQTLDEQLNYVQSFHLLKRSEIGGDVIFPMASHPRNCPLFPSVTWAAKAGERSTVNNLSRHQGRFESSWRVLEEFSKRIVERLASRGNKGAIDELLYEIFIKATRSAAAFEASYGLSNCGQYAAACSTLAIQYARQIANTEKRKLETFLHFEQFVRGLFAKNKRSVEKLIRLTANQWLKRLSSLSKETLTRPRMQPFPQFYFDVISEVPINTITDDVICLFAIGVFERASFIALEFSSSESVQPSKASSFEGMMDYTTRFNSDEVGYYDAGRLLFHHLAPARTLESRISNGGKEELNEKIARLLPFKIEDHSEAETASQIYSNDDRFGSSEESTFIPKRLHRTRERADMLALWICRRASSLKDCLSYHEGSQVESGLSKMGVACVSLACRFNSKSIADSLTNFCEWEAKAFDVDVSPFSRLSDCRELYGSYAPSLAQTNLSTMDHTGYSIAIHSLGSTGQIGDQRVAVELYRVDVFRDSARWFPDLNPNDLSRINRLDHLFMHAEQLIIAEETKRLLDDQKNAFEESMLGFTAEMAHSLKYQVDRIIPAEALAKELAQACRVLAARYRQEHSQHSFPLSIDAGVEEVKTKEDYEKVFGVLQRLLLRSGIGIHDNLLTLRLAEELKNTKSTELPSFDWINDQVKGVRMYLENVLDTTARTSRNKPEIKTGGADDRSLPQNCNLLELFETIVAEQSKTLRYELRLTLDSNSLDVKEFFPAFSFRYLICPELFRNAAKYGMQWLRLEAALKDRHFQGIGYTKVLSLVVSNPIREYANTFRSTGIGVMQIERTLRANLPSPLPFPIQNVYRTARSPVNGVQIFTTEIDFPSQQYELAVKQLEAPYDSI